MAKKSIANVGRCVVFGKRGIVLQIMDDIAEGTLPAHLLALTRASASLQRAVFNARFPSGWELSDEDLAEAQAGIELVSNMAVEVAEILEAHANG